MRSCLGCVLLRESTVVITAGIAWCAVMTGTAKGEPRTPQGAPPLSIEVHSEAELAAAARASESNDVNIMVPDRVVLRGGVYFPKSDAVVRIIGVGPHAAIHFEMTFDGNWSNPAFKPQNGLEFNGRAVVIRGMHFSGYDWLGAAIKGSATELLDISDCTFESMCSKSFPPRRNPPANAADSLFNQCIGAHDLKNGHISIVNCRFMRCALSEQRWSHCLYISGRSVVVTGNEFRECGNPFSVGDQVAGAVNSVFGNRVIDPQPSLDPRGDIRPAYLAHLGDEDSTAFMFNTMTGHYLTPWTGTPATGRHLVDYNDWSQATFEGPWAADLAAKSWLTQQDWTRLGFDRHSILPSKRDGAAVKPSPAPDSTAAPSPSP